MSILIYGGTIVNEGRTYRGSIVIEGEQIARIKEGEDAPRGNYDKEVDATGCFILPGVIDEHVHFREPGLAEKADIESESRAAAYGGITSFFDMPNTKPGTCSLETLVEKFELARQKSHVNYSFFFGATNDNSVLFRDLDRHRIPGIKLFMGASTGNMLVDRQESLQRIFSTAAELGLPVMTHCEDTRQINANMQKARTEYGDDPEIRLHPMIRSEEACYDSTAHAVALARKYGTRLHVAHLTTARELEFFGQEPAITAEAVIAHLYFCDKDYETLGALIKCNPAVKTSHDREALRRGLVNGKIFTVGTDHAPHLLSEKQGGCARAASGMPMIQFSLSTMLELADEGILTIADIAALMCHHPATLFGVRERGFIRQGYAADLVIVCNDRPWKVTKDVIQSKCKWSPMIGHEYQWRVRQTFCNGHLIYNEGVFDENSSGQEIKFR
ncbi:dihydroorotase [Prevotella sp. KH2C16]|uniref:dihydroorotase n=1 Tax=Prevotella sp. KH2C16 TaxID=1855325 RepID=UPI0008E4D1CA|nr:dihydroorotase [Prevotella sp. KH2C16]SFG29164.1 dihydroorotase [Prevotella sp. KH2C16]